MNWEPVEAWITKDDHGRTIGIVVRESQFAYAFTTDPYGLLWAPDLPGARRIAERHIT